MVQTDPQATRQPLPEGIVEQLRAIVGAEYVLTEEWDRLTYSYDASFLSALQPGMPDVVAQPPSDARQSARDSAASARWQASFITL